MSKKNTFVLEGINSTYEKIENTDVDSICVPIENHSQSITSYNDVTTERTAKEDITEQNEETMSRRTFLQDPMKNTSKMTRSSPRLYLTLSGQSQKQLTEHETIAREVKKYQVGETFKSSIYSCVLVPQRFRLSLCFISCFIIDSSHYKT